MKKKKRERRKMKKKKSRKPKSMPFVIFLRESFAVHIGDHLLFGIICGSIWGSFPVWGSFAALYNPPLELAILLVKLNETALYQRLLDICTSIL